MQLKNKKQKFITLKEAAANFGYASDYIGWLIRKGKIPGKKVRSWTWKVSQKALLDYLNKNKKNIHQKRWTNWLLNQRYISLKEAAKISGYTSDYIGYLIRKGEIPGKRVCFGINWLTTEEAIKNYREKKERRKKKILITHSPFTLFWRKGFLFSLRISKYSLIFTILGLIIFSGLVAWAFGPKNPIQIVEIYPIQYEGDWQNPQNAIGPPAVLDDGNLNAFSETNSAIYQKGPLTLILSKIGRAHV